MSKIKILVVEDESIVAKDIQNTLIRLGYDVPATASNAASAFQKLDDIMPDLVFLDIKLKGDIDGIEIAEKIKNSYEIPVIFLTSFVDKTTLDRAKVTEPYGYIIKPFKEVDLHTSIEMALYKYSKEKEVLKERDLFYSLIENKDSKEFIFVKSKSRLVKIKTEDIYYVEALKDYVVINTLDARYTIHSTMKDIISKLSAEAFIRVHRSFIVRVSKIASIEYPNLYLENDKKVIPIGGSYKDELLEKLNLL